MITLNDYLYSGDTLLRIRQKYIEDLRKEARRTRNEIDLVHCTFLLQIRELLEQDRAFLDEKQVQMTLAREFYLAGRLKNEKPDTAYTLLSTIETKFRDNGFTTRRAGKEDLKRLLAIYFEQNTTTERFEDYDGQRFMEATG